MIAAATVAGCAGVPAVDFSGRPSRNWEAPIVAVLADLRVQGDPAGTEPGFRPALTRHYRRAVQNYLATTVGIVEVFSSPDGDAAFDEGIALVELLARARRFANHSTNAQTSSASVGSILSELAPLAGSTTLVLVAGSVTLRVDEAPVNDLVVAAVEIETGNVIAISGYDGSDDLLDEASLASVLERMLRQ